MSIDICEYDGLPHDMAHEARGRGKDKVPWTTGRFICVKCGVIRHESGVKANIKVVRGEL